MIFAVYTHRYGWVRSLHPITWTNDVNSAKVWDLEISAQNDCSHKVSLLHIPGLYVSSLHVIRIK